MVFENRLSDDFNKSNPAGAEIRDTQIFLQFSKRNPKAIIVSMSWLGHQQKVGKGRISGRKVGNGRFL